MTPSWAQIRRAFITFAIVVAMGAGVFVAVRNTEAIQRQRTQSIISDCQKDDMRYTNAVALIRKYSKPGSNTGPLILLIDALAPYHKDCQALASSKVTS